MKPFQPNSYSNRALYLRLLSYLKPYWKPFALAVLGMVGMAATEPVFPALMKYLLDQGFKASEPYMVWLIPLGIILLFVVRGAFSFTTNYLMTWISTHLGIDMQRQLFAKLLTLPSQTYHDQSPARLITRILGDVGTANHATTTVLVTAVRESLTVVALIGYLLYLDWKLTLLTLTIAPVLALIIKSFSLRMRQSSRMTVQALRTLAHTVEEAVNAHKVVKIFGAQPQMGARFESNLAQIRRAFMREAVPSSAITPITHLAASVAVASIVFVALSQVTGGAGASAGGFVSFITALLMLISPIKQLSTINVTLQRSLAACESIFELLDADSERDTGTQNLQKCRGQIEFEHVSFRYPGAERPALQNVSFTIPAGRTFALVGGSGGGKTTISALIPRFYEPTAGRILIDGVDTRELTLQSLRRHIALVSQDIVLFNDTVAHNIAFGSTEKKSREDIIAAAQAAHAWDFIQQLPDGLDTFIGEDGAKLSGGQRQRIAIARALLKNAPILILDEATSALDTESERQVQAALATLMQGRTTLVIAHRLSTIEHADQILVLDQGRIVERGTHAELLAAGGYYANLTRMQGQEGRA
ncbi:MAG: lipid A export permease/ATP-binding protein MsbA [Hylemonella sp.]